MCHCNLSLHSFYDKNLTVHILNQIIDYIIAMFIDTCPTGSGSATHVDRQMLAVPTTQELYACTIAEPG